MLLWLPLTTALGFLAVWLWITSQIFTAWTLHAEAALKWQFLSIGAFVLSVLFFLLLFPCKPARGLKITAASVGLVALLLGTLFWTNTRVVSYQVRDVDGEPLEGIPIDVTHHANGIDLTWFPGGALLRTDKDGIASLRIFKSEECDADVNNRQGNSPGYGNSGYSEDNVFFTPAGAEEQIKGSALGSHDIVEHSYKLQFPNELPTLFQRCLESPLNPPPGVIHVYLRHKDSPSLPPYLDQIVGQKVADPALRTAQLISLGGSIQGFNHLDTLLSALSGEDSQRDVALYGLDLLASQIQGILTDLPKLTLDVNIPRQRYLSTNDQRQQCSRMLYVWLSGNSSSSELSHPDRIAYIKQRLDEATLKIIDALHPVMLKNKEAYRVLNELREYARPAMKFYPEVFEKGTEEARQAALGVLIEIVPSAKDVAFLIRSKNPAWITQASWMGMNSNAADLSDNLTTLENLKAQESDPQNVAAFAQVIKAVRTQFTRYQAEEADKPLSTVEPRYVVIDLGRHMLQLKTITNSGYVLGSDGTSPSVWFEGVESTLQPKVPGDTLTVDDIDESGTVMGTESGPALSGSSPHRVNLALWEKGTNPPKLTASSPSALKNKKPSLKDRMHTMNLPQIAGSSVVPQAANSALAPLHDQNDVPLRPVQLVPATQVIGNGPGAGYLWEMTPALSTSKTFEGPFPINLFLPGEPNISPWRVTSVASINDGGTIIGTAIYKSAGSNDTTAPGLHAVMLMPLAIVRETTPGSGDFEPIVDNGLDDNATIPIFASAPPHTPNSSDPETDGQGIFYIEMPGSIPASITLRSGENKVTVLATPVSGRLNLLRTGKLVMIANGDPFRAPDITTIEAGPQSDGRNPTLELQKYERTIVR